MDGLQWRTLIVEDSPAVAEVHRRLVASVARVRRFGVALDRRRARGTGRALRPHLLLLDLGLPDGDGLPPARRCAARASRSR
jgi:two-component system CitB family response regulator